MLGKYMSCAHLTCVCFPCLDLFLPFPLYIWIAVNYGTYAERANVQNKVLFAASGGIAVFFVVLRLEYLFYKTYLCDRIEQLVLGFINADSTHDGKAFIVLGGRVTICENIGSNIFQFPLVEKARSSRDNFIAKTQLVLERPVEGTSTTTCMSLSMAYATASRSQGRKINGPQTRSQVDGEQTETWQSWLDHFPVDDATAGFLIQWLSAEPQRSIFRFCGVATATADSIDGSIEMLQEELPSVEALGENCFEIQGLDYPDEHA